MHFCILLSHTCAPRRSHLYAITQRAACENGLSACIRMRFRKGTLSIRVRAVHLLFLVLTYDSHNPPLERHFATSTHTEDRLRKRGHSEASERTSHPRNS